jgi:peroxiredoxin
MVRFRILVFLFSVTFQCLYSQVNIQITVEQTRSKLAKLYLCQRPEAKLIDSTISFSQGIFRFKLPANYEQGLYKLALSKNISFDFIVASEPQITLETVVFAAEDSLRSIESKENEVYFQYQKIRKRLNQQIWFINSLIDYYPDTSCFRKNLYAELYRTQFRLYNESNDIANRNPQLYASSLILLELMPIPKVGTTLNDRKTFQKKNWWNNSNLSDSRLLNSQILQSKLWGFVDLYFDNSYDKEQQDSAFVSAAEILMNLHINQSFKEFIRNALFRNYLDTDYDAVTKYLFETSFSGLSPLVLTPDELNILKIQQSNGIGTKAKDFSIPKVDGSKIKLSKINSSYKLVVFWSMWCPHCTEMLPELYETYLKFKGEGFEVIAICIDDEVDVWSKFVTEKYLGWINTIETDNGSNRVISEYTVDGTPKLYLLDKNLTIISRPSNVKQVEAKLIELLKKP